MVNLQHIREMVVRPALKHLLLWSPEAEELVMCTGMIESRFTHLTQVPKGPARGHWQMEKATFYDIRMSFERSRPETYDRLLQLSLSEIDPFDQMLGNNYLGAAMCRLHYRRVKHPLPTTVKGMADYWKTYYNTYLGKGKVKDFIIQARRMYQVADTPFSDVDDWPVIRQA